MKYFQYRNSFEWNVMEFFHSFSSNILNPIFQIITEFGSGEIVFAIILLYYYCINKEFAKNYTELRDKQTRLTRARMAELKLENDFFKSDERNVNDLELVKNPLRDLPDDVVAKVNTYRSLHS